MTARTRLEKGIARGWPLPPSDVAEVLAESDAHRTRADAAEADRDALRAECERLRAIVEGRTTAPTDAEIDAHWRAGGAWLVSGSVVTGAYEVRRLASLGIAHLTWVPLGGTLHGRTPCAWPVTP